jgi:hypothetical protein
VNLKRNEHCRSLNSGRMVNIAQLRNAFVKRLKS